MPDCDQITIVQSQGVMQIGINRPEKTNALNIAMYEALGEAFLDADEDPSIKSIVLHGTAEAFTSGNDLSDFANRDPSKPSAGAQFLLIAHELKKPLVAAVSGVAIGIGTTLLLHCDLVYASPDARFRMPFVPLGLCPEAGSSLLLPAIVGHRRAAEVLLLGDFFSTEKAMELGFVNQAVAADQVLEHAIEKAQQLAQMSLPSLMLTKKLLKQADHQSVAERIEYEISHFDEMLRTPESIAARERILNGSKKRA